jgi:hypothetical protein
VPVGLPARQIDLWQDRQHCERRKDQVSLSRNPVGVCIDARSVSSFAARWPSLPGLPFCSMSFLEVYTRWLCPVRPLRRLIFY